MDNAMSVIENVDISSFQSTMKRINQFQRLVRENLSEGRDYGVIPGVHKPTLLKPGAEKILMLMGLQSTYEILDSTRDWENGFFQYQVRCTLMKGDAIITQGLGCCNTREKKYSKMSGYDIDNTVLKMAKKRAQIDATLTVASLSEIFTQDVEDIDIPSEQEQNIEKPPRPATEKQINLIYGSGNKKGFINSEYMTEEERERLERIKEGLSIEKASEIIQWWIGDEKKGIAGERAKREKMAVFTNDEISDEDLPE